MGAAFSGLRRQTGATYPARMDVELRVLHWSFKTARCACVVVPMEIDPQQNVGGRKYELETVYTRTGLESWEFTGL